MADDKNRRLCEAAYRNDREGVRRALAEGADIRARAEFGGHPARSALGWATTGAMAELLLDAGAEIDAEDAEGYTPLSRALSHQWMEAVDVLVRRGADPNYMASPKHVPPVDMALQVSVQAGLRLLEAGGRVGPNTRRRLWLHSESLALLEEWPIRGASLPDPDKQLMLAARAGDLETVKGLIANGASPTARDTEGASALDHALRRRNIEVARVLERAVLAPLGNAKLFLLTLDDCSTTLLAQAPAFDLEARTPRGMTALMLAARYRRHRALQALLTLGADIEPRNGASTPLVEAIESGDLHGMLLLLDHGAAMNFAVDGANPVLAAAIAAPDSDLLEHLLARGIEVPPRPYPSYGEADRLLKCALAGIRPHVGPPTFASWSACRICSELPDPMHWCLSARGEFTGEHLPAVTEQQFKRYDELWKCTECATYYAYDRDHDNGLTDGWDSEDLKRLSLDAARKRLEAMTGPRNDRECARAAFAAAVAAPGRKVQISGEDVTDGRRAVLIYRLDPGAERLAWHRVLESEHDAIAAELASRGIERAETDFDSNNDFIWVRRADGIEVYDAERKVLDVSGEWATLADGRRIGRGELVRVIAFADDDYVARGVRAVLTSGEEVHLVLDCSASAMINYQYNRNDLLFETVWCSAIGHAIASWAGTALENLI